MPKINLEDIIVEIWETLQPQTFEESQKSLEFLQKLLTK